MYAQNQPSTSISEAAPASEKSAADKRAAEWSTLASNLEQRIARLLPCDAHVRSAIEEVSRASDARFAALTASWQEAAKRSKEQAEAAGTLIADNDARRAVWKNDRADSQQEETRLRSQVTALQDSARQQPALAPASRELNGITQSSNAIARRAADREHMAAQFSASLDDLIEASQARQAAIENELKALATESSRWSAYYAARVTRARMECSLTGAASASDDAAPRTKAKKNR